MPANNLRTFGFGVKAFKHFYEVIRTAVNILR